VLTNLGEKMSDEDVTELLTIIDTDNNEVNYRGPCPHLPPFKPFRS
jgi:Ca2+-binding EF-hand superfamily protein